MTAGRSVQVLKTNERVLFFLFVNNEDVQTIANTIDLRSSSNCFVKQTNEQEPNRI